MGYSTRDMIEKLKNEENIDISLRTLNYYTHDLKMFPNLFKGKCGYTDREVELLKRIHFLKENTSLSLTEIKELINNDDEYKNVINSTIFNKRSEYTRVFNNPEVNTFSSQTNKPNYNDNNVSLSASACCDNLSTSCALNCETSHSPVSNYCNVDTACSFGASSNVEASNMSFYEASKDSMTPAANFFFTSSTPVPDSNFTPLRTNVVSKQSPVQKETTVKINKDVTISVSEEISREKLIEIINYINSIT